MKLSPNSLIICSLGILSSVLSNSSVAALEFTKRNSNNDTLIFAHVIYRHGERATTGSMQLNNEGMKQVYELGQFFRRRYRDLFAEPFASKKVYVLSTDHDRAIMSAQVNLAGIFTPRNEEIWNKDLLWRPVSVHTIQPDLDILLRPIYGDRCKNYQLLYDYYMTESPEALEMKAKYGHNFSFWEEKSGQKIKTVADAFSMFKDLTSGSVPNESLPEWLQEAIKPNGSMKEIAKTVYKLRSKTKLVRFRCGFLIKEMLEHFSKKVNGSLSPDLSLYMYSAHSSTISNLMNSLGMNVDDVLDHGSSFQFELYKTKGGEHYLQIFLRSPDEEYPIPKPIPGCGQNCKLEKFYSVFDHLIPGEFAEECDKLSLKF